MKEPTQCMIQTREHLSEDAQQRSVGLGVANYLTGQKIHHPDAIGRAVEDRLAHRAVGRRSHYSRQWQIGRLLGEIEAVRGSGPRRCADPIAGR